MHPNFDRLFEIVRQTEDALESHRTLGLAGISNADTVLNALRAVGQDTGLRRIVADLDRTQDLARFAIGPLEELSRAAEQASGLALSREFEGLQLKLDAFDARFRLPDIAEQMRLVAGLTSSVEETLGRYNEQQASFTRLLDGLSVPWLDSQQQMRSLNGLASLYGIGNAVKKMPAFGPELNSALRLDLGDWRDEITWPTEIFTDLGARSAFYLERGFNPALTDFPAAAFEESIDLVGLDHEPPPLVVLYGEPILSSDDEEEEAGLCRTNKAHDWLLRFENHIRRFIDERMTRAYGPEWPKHRLPNGLYDAWKDKQEKVGQRRKRDRPLIAYADFTDYIRVIERRDNWGVFAPYFGRIEAVRESFQRLYPIRVDTMHARPIAQDDELLLYVEVQRLVRVMTRDGD